MSTTAQDDQQQIAPPTPEEMAAADAAAAAAAAPAPTPASDREYTLFEEARSDTWTQIGKAEARSPEAALETLGEAKLKEPKRFMAIPSRFVVPRKPKVNTVTTVTFE